MTEPLFLSRLRLDARHADAAGALRDAQALHALTMRSLPREATRAEANLLHRADLAAAVVLVQSTVRPAWPQTTAFEAQCKEITAAVHGLEPGRRLRFSLRAVPMKRRSVRLSDGTAVPDPGEHALRTDAERVAWLERKLAPAAVLVHPPRVTVEPARAGHRGGRRFIHRPVFFDGVIEVRDTTALRVLVTRGVGRGRSYGNGLLMFTGLPTAFLVESGP